MLCRQRNIDLNLTLLKKRIVTLRYNKAVEPLKQKPTERSMMKMANVAVTFNTDERIKDNFEQVCASLGMNSSTGFNILMRIALREHNLLLGEKDSFQLNKVDYQRQQKNAAYDFINTVNSAEEELTTEDYKEFESGKYKVKLNIQELSI